LSEIFNVNLQVVARRKSVIDVFGSTNQEQDFLGSCSAVLMAQRMPRVLYLNLQCTIITFGLMYILFASDYFIITVSVEQHTFLYFQRAELGTSSVVR
jgi:hypothetical protein